MRMQKTAFCLQNIVLCTQTIVQTNRCNVPSNLATYSNQSTFKMSGVAAEDRQRTRMAKTAKNLDSWRLSETR